MLKLSLLNIKKFRNSTDIAVTIFEDLKIFFKDPLLFNIVNRTRFVFFIELFYKLVKGHVITLSHQQYQKTS